jgi:hypothetical protein
VGSRQESEIRSQESEERPQDAWSPSCRLIIADSLDSTLGAEVGNVALSLGERVARDPDILHRDVGRVRGHLHGEEGVGGPM